jgi:hypothetical protein
MDTRVCSENSFGRKFRKWFIPHDVKLHLKDAHIQTDDLLFELITDEV